MPYEGLFNLAVSTFFKSNTGNKPFWDEDFLKDAKWEWFLKSFPTEFNSDGSVKDFNGDPWNDEPKEGDEDNLFMTMANPYMKAVKHYDAIRDALKDPKNKKPIWVGPKKFRYKDIPKTYFDEFNIERNNRNLSTLNILNWFTHNSYLEIPMSQHQALYFDSRAVESIESGIQGIGQMLTTSTGLSGIRGIVGGMFGGPLGALFGGVLANLLGRTALGKGVETLIRWFGSVIGAAAGFIWNSSGKNSLTDDQVRQLPGLMCILPKDKLELYIKTLFHMSSTTWGKNHARLPYNYFTTAETYPDKLSSVLGKSEISFTFSLSDNITYRRYNSDNGSLDYNIYKGRTMDIGQESGGYIPLVDEKVRVLEPFQGKRPEEIKDEFIEMVMDP